MLLNFRLRVESLEILLSSIQLDDSGVGLVQVDYRRIEFVGLSNQNTFDNLMSSEINLILISFFIFIQNPLINLYISKIVSMASCFRLS